MTLKIQFYTEFFRLLPWKSAKTQFANNFNDDVFWFSINAFNLTYTIFMHQNFIIRFIKVYSYFYKNNTLSPPTTTALPVTIPNKRWIQSSNLSSIHEGKKIFTDTCKKSLPTLVTLRDKQTNAQKTWIQYHC